MCLLVGWGCGGSILFYVYWVNICLVLKLSYLCRTPIKTNMVTYKITNPETFEERVTDVEFDNISCSFDRVGSLCSVSGSVTIEKPNGTKSIFSGEHGLRDYMRDYGFIIEEIPTFDVEFNSDNDSDSKGFEMTLDEAQDYVETWNGTGKSYFGDYKGGTVSIINNLTGESVEDFEIK